MEANSPAVMCGRVTLLCHKIKDSCQAMTGHRTTWRPRHHASCWNLPTFSPICASCSATSAACACTSATTFSGALSTNLRLLSRACRKNKS